MTTEKDIVLIHIEDKPLAFARIEEISPDNKADWYHVSLLILQVPLQTATWILRDSYIDGEEFTMGEKKIRLEPVVCPESFEKPDAFEKESKVSRKLDGAKVISLADRKKIKP